MKKKASQVNTHKHVLRHEHFLLLKDQLVWNGKPSICLLYRQNWRVGLVARQPRGWVSAQRMQDGSHPPLFDNHHHAGTLAFGSFVPVQGHSRAFAKLANVGPLPRVGNRSHFVGIVFKRRLFVSVVQLATLRTSPHCPTYMCKVRHFLLNLAADVVSFDLRLVVFTRLWSSCKLRVDGALRAAIS